MATEYQEVVRKIEALPIEDQQRVLDLLLRRLAIPLPDPRRFFDDWDDAEVDRAYEAR
ncbi:MAG TPA: hypothetical protein GX513_14725 [Firmicutes bacterium]|nr:hypothetical protein [Bacillota bacterium]